MTEKEKENERDEARERDRGVSKPGGTRGNKRSEISSCRISLTYVRRAANSDKTFRWIMQRNDIASHFPMTKASSLEKAIANFSFKKRKQIPASRPGYVNILNKENH